MRNAVKPGRVRMSTQFDSIERNTENYDKNLEILP